MEAPEKIYIQSFNVSEEDAKFDKSKMFFDDVWTEEPELGQENVEYTRTDILIEKTLKWIDATFHGTSIDGYGGESVDVVISDASVHKDDLFESFKNYIKGE